MIDIRRLRAEPDVVTAALARKKVDRADVARVLALDERARSLNSQRDEIRGRIKTISKDVAQAQIPGKDATVLNDAKVLVWSTDVEGDGTDIQRDKILGTLDAVKDGRSIYTGELLTSAIYFNSILSLPFVLDQLVPQLEKVLPG